MRQFLGNQRGSVMVIFSVAMPVLMVMALGTINYATLVSHKSTLQGAADSAALSAVRSLNVAYVTDQSIDASVKNLVAAALSTTDSSAMQIATKVGTNRTSLSVTITQSIPMAGGQLVGMAAVNVTAKAQATLVGGSPLCLLTLDTKLNGVLHFEKNAQLTAPGCTVYSNSTGTTGLQADNGSYVVSSRFCSAGGYGIKGATITPTPIADCPTMPDPLSSQPKPTYSATCVSMPYSPSGRPFSNNTIDNGTITIDPGTYCGGLQVTKKSQVTLNPGLYVIKDGPLIVKDQAFLTANNVTFYFVGDSAGVRFDDKTTISLSAPTTGTTAGFLFREDPSIGSPIAPPLDPLQLLPPPPPPLYSPPMRQYQITSSNARTMLGTIYLPVGRVIIDAKKPVADQSAYTVIVAQQVEIFDGPNLYLNANYGATTVPVPVGVGPTGSSSILTR